MDLDGVRFNFKAYRKQTDRYGYERCFKEYEAEKYDADQNIIEEALTPKGKVRKIRVNPELEYYKAKQREYLSDKDYQEVYGIRKIDVEPAFGFLKATLGFTRCHVRGNEKVNNEVGLALMACNMRKLTLRSWANKKTQEFYSLRIRFWVFFGLIIQPLRDFFNIRTTFLAYM